MEHPKGFRTDGDIVIRAGSFVSLHSTPNPEKRVLRVLSPGQIYFENYNLEQAEMPLVEK